MRVGVRLCAGFGLMGVDDDLEEARTVHRAPYRYAVAEWGSEAECRRRYEYLRGEIRRASRIAKGIVSSIEKERARRQQGLPSPPEPARQAPSVQPLELPAEAVMEAVAFVAECCEEGPHLWMDEVAVFDRWVWWRRQYRRGLDHWEWRHFASALRRVAPRLRRDGGVLWGARLLERWEVKRARSGCGCGQVNCLPCVREALR